jgi:hypothetical protein
MWRISLIVTNDLYQGALMPKTNNVFLFAIVMAVALLAGIIVSCAKTTTTSTTATGSIGGSLIQTDSIIKGQITVIKSMTTGYPWEIDVMVTNSQNVGDLKNPTIDKVGQVVQFRTDESPVGLQPGQSINAHVKLTGDVEVGTTLYIYNIQQSY